jgi:hypothetical protein
MLKSIDVLIGLTVIMLALSMAVTVVTQFVTTVVNSRGHHLKRGLVDLLAQIDPSLRGKVGRQIAKAVLTHPLVSATGNRLGSVVHRDEFTKLLLQLAASDDESFREAAGTALSAALTRNGVSDPAETLKKIRRAAVDLEASHPDLGNAARSSLAVIKEAKSDLVATVNGWFDQTMDRVAQRFTASTRAITFVAAAIVTVALQVDTLLLVNRLSADDKLREAFLATARTTQESRAASTGAGSPAAEIDRQYMAYLAENGLITVPASPAQWMERWPTINPFGLVLTALLLSLGAPFWYNSLGRLLQLRSVIAAKDDRQRATRQRATPPAEDGQGAAPPVAAGERGKVAASS